MRNHKVEPRDRHRGDKRATSRSASPHISSNHSWVRLALTVCAMLISLATTAAQIKPSEYDVKAAYILNFGKFVRHGTDVPPQRKSFEICVIGQDPFGRTLDQLTANESIGGRAVRVSRLAQLPRTEPCDVAFISQSEGKRLEQDLEALRPTETLTVSDAPDFLERGGMIQLLLVSNHVRFAVNLGAVRRTNLVLSSDLLRVAVSVTGNTPGEVQP